MTSKDISTIRHLLHHLGDAEALRSNELVAEVLPMPDADERQLCEDILRRVRRAVESLGERRGPAGIIEREIVRRCDLEHAQHKVVVAVWEYRVAFFTIIGAEHFVISPSSCAARRP